MDPLDLARAAGIAKNLQPVPQPLADRMAKQLELIPGGRLGQVGAAVTNTGVEFGGGLRKQVKKADLKVSGWAGREWGKPGWSTGASVGLAF